MQNSNEKMVDSAPNRRNQSMNGFLICWKVNIFRFDYLFFIILADLDNSTTQSVSNKPEMTLADRIKLKREQMKTEEAKTSEKPNEKTVQANANINITCKNSTLNKSGASIQNVTFREPESILINEITPSTSKTTSKLSSDQCFFNQKSKLKSLFIAICRKCSKCISKWDSRWSKNNIANSTNRRARKAANCNKNLHLNPKIKRVCKKKNIFFQGTIGQIETRNRFAHRERVWYFKQRVEEWEWEESAYKLVVAQAATSKREVDKWPSENDRKVDIQL